MGNKNESLIGHIKNAFIYTFAGLETAWKNELAFRGEIVVAIVMVPLGLWLGEGVGLVGVLDQRAAGTRSALGHVRRRGDQPGECVGHDARLAEGRQGADQGQGVL